MKELITIILLLVTCVMSLRVCTHENILIAKSISELYVFD